MAARVRLLTLAVLAGLGLLILAWAFGLGTGRVTTGFPSFALFVLPLLLPLPGLLADRAKAYVWTALIALLYLLHGLVTALSTPAEHGLGIAESLLAMALLMLASLQARWLARQGR